MLEAARQIRAGELGGLLLRLPNQLILAPSLAQEHWRGSQADVGPSPRCMASSAPSKSEMQHSSSEGALAANASASPQQQSQQQGALHPVLAHVSSLSPSSLALQPPAQQLKRAKYTPWVFTRHLSEPRGIVQRMGFLMQSLEEEQVRTSAATRPIPEFRSGDILEVRMLVPEVGRREYTFRGVCLGRYNKGLRSSFKLYNVFPESGPVIQHIPLYMPDLLGIKVVGRIRARRNKLYHELIGKNNSSHQYQDAPEAALPDLQEAELAEAGAGSKKKATSKAKK